MIYRAPRRRLHRGAVEDRQKLLVEPVVRSTCDNDKTGFQVGASVNACTKGLWLWGEPVRLPDGLTVLFIDTEGLG